MRWGVLFFILLIQVALVSSYIAEVTVSEGDLVVLKPEAVDPDDDEITFSFSSPFDEQGRWQTTYDDAGSYIIEVNASDGEFVDRKQVLLIVNETDRQPFFEFALEDIHTKENQEIMFYINATDPDGDEISYFSFNMPNNANLTENLFYWKPGYDTVRKNWFERILSRYFNYVTKRTFDITFIARSKDKETTQTMEIVVEDVNRPPVIHSINDIPVDKEDDVFITVKEGEELIIRPYATDPDGDNVRYWYSGFSDSSTRHVDYGEEGIHNLVVYATDGKIFSSQNVTVLVEKTNRPPVIESINKTNVYEGEAVNFKVSAYDPDGDDIVYLVADNMPGGATFTDNTFEWTPDFDTVENGKKEFIIGFYAADYNLTAEKIVRITVNDKNRAPIVVNATPEQIIKIYEGEMVTFKVNGFDYDNDTITYKWKFGTFETYTDGNIHSRIFTIPGRKNVDVIVSDGIEEASYRWTVDVFERTTIPQPEEQIFKRYVIDG